MASREDWSGKLGQVWAASQEPLDRLLGPAASAGLDALSPAADAHILDLGCGAGASTVALLDRIGPDGRISAIDVSPDLLQSARDRVGGDSRAEIIEADAECHAFENSFDGLFSRFGSMFFDNPEAAFLNLHASLKPGAPAVFVAWREAARNQWASVPMTFVMQGNSTPTASPGPGPFGWADPAVFEPLLKGAGFKDVNAKTHEYMAEISMGDNPDPVARAIAFMSRVGPMASRMKDLSPEARKDTQDFLARRLARHVQDNALRLLASAWIITATA